MDTTDTLLNLFIAYLLPWGILSPTPVWRTPCFALLISKPHLHLQIHGRARSNSTFLSQLLLPKHPVLAPYGFLTPMTRSRRIDSNAKPCIETYSFSSNSDSFKIRSTSAPSAVYPPAHRLISLHPLSLHRFVNLPEYQAANHSIPCPLW